MKADGFTKAGRSTSVDLSTRADFSAKEDSWEMARRRLSEAVNRAFGMTGSPARHRTSRMDISWVTDRVAVGGGIWNTENMADVVRAGVTHIIDMQLEFDDTEIAGPFDVEVLWNPIDDDFQPKPPEVFERGVEFAEKAMEGAGNRVLVHCAAGVHRAPMMTLAILGAMGWNLEDAMELIEGRRPVVDFAEVYVQSVENFLAQRLAEK
jgi:protein-tyrosine phosphatase